MTRENRHKIAESTKLAQQYTETMPISDRCQQREVKIVQEARDERRATQTKIHKKAKARHKRPGEDNIILPRGDATERGSYFPWPCTA